MKRNDVGVVGVSDAFGIMLACAAFVLGVALGMYLATTRYEPVQKGKPVSDRRFAKLDVIDPILNKTERQHITTSPYRRRQL